MTFSYLVTPAAAGSNQQAPFVGGIRATDPGGRFASDDPKFTITTTSGGIRATDPGGLFVTQNPAFLIQTDPGAVGDVTITAADPGGLSDNDTVNFQIDESPPIDPPDPPEPGTEHPMSQNVNGGFISNNTTQRNWNPNDPLYLFLRVTQFNASQTTGMWDGSRVAKSAQWADMHADNPYALYVMHDEPLRCNAPYAQKNNIQGSWRYRYLVNNRRDALLYRDQDDDDEVPFIEAGSSLTANNQTAHHFKTADPGLQDHWSSINLDLLTGANKMGRSMSGTDVSDYIGYFNDGSPAVNPKFNRTTTETKLKGAVVDAEVDGSGALGISRNIVELDGRYNPTLTPDQLAQDSSFGELANPDYIGFCPANQNSPGYSAFVVIGYKTVGSGNCQVYVRDLPSTATAAQLYAVKNGDAFNINDSKNGTDNPDQDGDGSPENSRDAGNKIWLAGYIAMYNQLDTKMLAEVGHKTGRGHNAGGTVQLKDTGGLPHPHGGFRTMDYMNAENGDSAGKFQPNQSSSTQEYTVRTDSMEKLMRGLYMMESYIRPNPGGWNVGKPRGVLYDITVWSGGNNYSFTNDPNNPGLMATYLRFYKALISTVPNTNMGYTIEVAWPCLIEEAFLDFDTGWVTPAPLGTFDPTGGGNGTAGFPVGSWNWASGGVGDFTSGSKRIYGRRLGTRHYMFINVAESPTNNRVYRPSHLSNPDPIVTGDDQITPADFASIYATGHLQAGETLKKIDPSTYVNARMTQFMKTNPLSASAWSNNQFQYGPRQSHPNDANNEGGLYTLSNTPIIARDNTFNDGSAINQGVAFDLGKQEAAIFEIV